MTLVGCAQICPMNAMLAETWANKLTETGKARAGTVITVSDEYGNIVCKVPITITRKQ